MSGTPYAGGPLVCPYCHPLAVYPNEGVAAVEGYCEKDPDAVGLEAFQEAHDTVEHRRRQLARRQHLKVVR